MRLLIVLSCVLLTACQAVPMNHTADRIEVEVNKAEALEYLLHLPIGYEPDGEAMPLILFLHGAGERGNNVTDVARHGPPKMIEQGHHFGAVVVSPQCPADQWWPMKTDLLLALLDKVIAEHNIDESRVYLTGLSMGGYGTFALAARAPERFAAAVPVCGGGTYLHARQLVATPMWVFHGEDDQVIPVEESTRMVDYMNATRGEKAKLTVYPGVGHNSWDKAYGEKKMWDWLFEQRRK